VRAGTTFPRLTTRGPADYTRLFQWLADFVPGEQKTLGTGHGSVRPPLLVLFGAGAPGNDDWQTPHRQLTRQLRRSDIVVFGVGEAAGSVGDLASGPELGFAADGLPDDVAVAHFAGFLGRYVIECGRAAADGTEAPAPAPTGFRSVED
jgi:uncharacterized protein YegL